MSSLSINNNKMGFFKARRFIVFDLIRFYQYQKYQK